MKNKHAQAMALKRWSKTTKKERSEYASKISNKRWNKLTKNKKINSNK